MWRKNNLTQFTTKHLRENFAGAFLFTGIARNLPGMMYGIIIVVLLAAWIGYTYYQKASRKKAVQVFPETYRAVLHEHVTFYQHLPDAEKRRFEQAMQDFLAHVTIEWIGTEPDEQDTVLVAASAVIPIFGFPEWRYRNLTSVLIYPATFNEQFQFEAGERNILGMVGSGYMNGQMILSRQALRDGFRQHTQRSNTGIHEFVHLLDKSDGAVDGVPENLLAHQYVLPWMDLMHKEIRKIYQGKSDIHPYGATNESEFLAVAAEYFFERPDQMREKHPELFILLQQIFHQSPGR